MNPKQSYPLDELTRVGMLSDQIVNTQRALNKAVSDARKAGAKWSQIALMLGVSTQAAWERYRDDKPERGQKTLIEQSTLFSDMAVLNEMERSEKRKKRKNAKGGEQY